MKGRRPDEDYTKWQYRIERIPYAFFAALPFGFLIAIVIIATNESLGLPLTHENMPILNQVVGVIMIVLAVYFGWKASGSILKSINNFTYPYTKFTYPEE